METKYTGKQIKEMLGEALSDYNPILGVSVVKDNKKINSDGNKQSMDNVKQKISEPEKKPVMFADGGTDIGNNKNMSNLMFDVEPSDEYKDRFKKSIEGDSTTGNASSTEGDLEVNKEFFKANKKATQKYIDDKHTTQTTGLVSKNIPMPKKPSAFESENKKYKRLNFKGTQFLSEKHLLSLIPEDFKTNGNVFIMKDKNQDEYLVEWKIETVKDGIIISEGVIKNKENKVKINEEFDKIKKLYNYNSKTFFTGSKNVNVKNEESIIGESLNKLKKLSDI